MRPLALAATLVLVPVAAEALLCTTRHGAVVERSSCKRKEAPLDLAAAGATGAKGEPGTRGPSTARLRAFDADGQPIGYVDGRGYILIPHQNRVLAVAANEGGFVRDGFLFFAAPGCVGPASVDGPGLLAAAAPMRGNTAYYAGDPITDVTYQSFQRGTEPPPVGCTPGTYDEPTGLCCTTGSATIPLGPAVPVDLSTFTPPFRVEVQR